MTALIVRIHETHVRKGLFDPACLLCVEAREKAEKQRPAWWGHLTARELTTRKGAA